MTLKGIEINRTIAEARRALEKDGSVGPGLRALFEVLITIIQLLLEKFVKPTSRNSHVAPSQDPNRPKDLQKKGLGKRKTGGQPGHEGSTIERVSNPDHIAPILIDRRTLPKGKCYRRCEDEVRQVIEITVSSEVTEYRAEVLVDEDGKQYVAEFPAEVTRPVQYGPRLKAQVVYLDIYQLLPLARIQDYFRDQVGIGISQGTIWNTVVQAHEMLAPFEQLAKERLQRAPSAHFDETGINIGGKLHWLHSASNDRWTLTAPHAKRGKEAMDAIGILPSFGGIACHDHWKAYFQYNQCLHVLCNAHHLRELEWVVEQHGHQWASRMQNFLLETNEMVRNTEKAALSELESKKRQRLYRGILRQADKECPPPKQSTSSGRREKKSKERNLIERLRAFETEALRFMKDPLAPFTNNQAERDIRMSKVQQKISGCFRSFEGAEIFCRIRSYLSTCQKNGIPPSDALARLFHGELPKILEKLAKKD
jgi:transposase